MRIAKVDMNPVSSRWIVDTRISPWRSGASIEVVNDFSGPQRHFAAEPLIAFDAAAAHIHVAELAPVHAENSDVRLCAGCNLSELRPPHLSRRIRGGFPDH